MLATILLVCGVLVSLGSGVLLAYGLCVGMFALFRIHARQVASLRVQNTMGPARLETAEN